MIPPLDANDVYEWPLMKFKDKLVIIRDHKNTLTLDIWLIIHTIVSKLLLSSCTITNISIASH